MYKKNYYSRLLSCVFICLFVHTYVFAFGKPSEKGNVKKSSISCYIGASSYQEFLENVLLTDLSIEETDITLEMDNPNEGSVTEIYRSLKRNSGFVKIATLSEDDGRYADNELNARTTYYYKFRAFKNGVRSALGFTYEITTFSKNYDPEIITEVVDGDRIEITFTDRSFNDIRYRLNERHGLHESFTMPDSGRTTTFVIQPIIPGDSYRLEFITTTNGYPEEKSFVVYATLISNNLLSPELNEWYIDQNDVAFDLLNNNGKGFTELYRSRSRDIGYELVQTLPADQEHFTDNDLSIRTQYFYKWRAVNGEDESPFSEPMEIHTQSINYWPTLSATAIDVNTVELSFTDNSENDTEYLVYGLGDNASVYEQFSMYDSGRSVTFRHTAVQGETYTYIVDVNTDSHPSERYYERVVTLQYTMPTGTMCTGTGAIQREVWTEVPGTDIASIPVNETPDQLIDLNLFETNNFYGNNYGARIRGYICPPRTGNYTFWIASDDKSELWLSSDESPNNKLKIASVGGATKVQQWTKYASQQSALRYLVAGQRYYIEALHKEASGADHLAVGWQLPDGTLERPMPGTRLIRFESFTPCVGTGKIGQEIWLNIPGTDISTVPFNAPPNQFVEYTRFETQQYYTNNYGSRMRTHLCVPSTGNYTFWISSDDRSQLYLSTDDQPSNKRLIASVTTATRFQQYDKYASQHSSPIHLVAGQKYYLEALHKEGNGNDFISVGWQLPDGTLERPIPGNRLLFIEGSTLNQEPTVTITSPSENAAFPSSSDITITANATDADGTITKVEFFVINTKIGEDLTSPYQIKWNDPYDGEHMIRARATDNSNSTTLDFVSIRVGEEENTARMTKEGQAPILVNEFNEAFKVYPNPTLNREVKLEFSHANFSGETRIQIVSISGKIVFEDRFTTKEKLAAFNIRLGNHVSPGVYLVKVIQGRKQWSKKLMVD